MAPVPGDFGATPQATTPAPSEAVLPGPRGDAPASPPRKSRMMKAKGGDSDKEKEDKPVDPAMINPDTFVPQAFCLMPKLSLCSAYGEKYERLASVPQFCAALGGEKASACPEESRVTRCLTPANVISSYYSSGEKPYTKESASEKCLEKSWIVLP